MYLTSSDIREIDALIKRFPLFSNRLNFLRIALSSPGRDISAQIVRLNVTLLDIEYWSELYRVGGVDLLLDSRTIINPLLNFRKKTISELGEEELLRLYNNHTRQVGSAVIADFRSCQRTGKPLRFDDCEIFKPYKDFKAVIKDWKITDCFTYIKSVLRYTFEKLGQRSTFIKLNKADRGTRLAQGLNRIGWKSYLCLRDTKNPYDNLEKHVKIYERALRTKKWWGVNLSGFIVDYKPNPTPPTRETVTPISVDGKRKFDMLSQVRFGVCTFTEGLHTGLFSRGEVYEVHWKSMSEQSKVDDPKYAPFYEENLYEKTLMQNFGWEEILLTIPPDSNVKLG